MAQPAVAAAMVELAARVVLVMEVLRQTVVLVALEALVVTYLAVAWQAKILVLFRMPMLAVTLRQQQELLATAATVATVATAEQPVVARLVQMVMALQGQPAAMVAMLMWVGCLGIKVDL